MLDDFREWLSDNLRYILLGLAVILVAVIIFCIVRLAGGSSHRKETEAQQQENVQAEQNENATESVPAAVPAQSAVSVNLTKDDSAVLTVIKQYYTSVAAGDTATLSSLVEPWNDEVEKETLGNNVIESYNNISTYSAPGAANGEYAVFTYYEAKMANIDTLAPTLVGNYLKTGSDGQLKVYPYHTIADSEVSDFITKLSAEDEVRSLISDVQTSYENALNADPDLKAYIDTLDTSDEASTEAGNTASADIAEGSEMTASTTINIRQSASTDSALMGVVPAGTTVTVTAQAEDGWVQISYDSSAGLITGYVRGEYLSAAGGTDGAADSGNAETAADAGQSADASAEPAGAA